MLSKLVNNFRQMFEKIDDINENQIKVDQKLIDKFIERTNKHIYLVNQYAKKINRSYPDHDKSKLGDLLYSYCFFSKSEEERTAVEQSILDMVTLVHITNSPHHPEYWTETNLSGFTRKNFTPNGPIDATLMPKEYLEEMLADWCSCSYEYKNHPIDWFNKVNGNRWIFTAEQQTFIKNIIKKLWGGFDEFK